MGRRPDPHTQDPGRVRFAPDFLERLGRLVVRVVGARERREGAGRPRISGGGLEFVGHRPYRPGEDLRLLDWSLYARLRRPFVRTSRRESNERWCVLLDTSASVALGAPTKFQACAELCLALAAVGLREGATIDVHLSGSKDRFRLRRRWDLGGCLAFLEQVHAEGPGGVGDLVREPGRMREAGAIFLVGDLLDLEPSDALSLARRGRDLYCLRVLAEEELFPSASGSVHWIDPESGRGLELELDDELALAYQHVVARDLERWGSACSRHRAYFGCWSSAEPFEGPVLAAFAT